MTLRKHCFKFILNATIFCSSHTIIFGYVPCIRQTMTSNRELDEHNNNMILLTRVYNATHVEPPKVTTRFSGPVNSPAARSKFLCTINNRASIHFSHVSPARDCAVCVRGSPFCPAGTSSKG